MLLFVVFTFGFVVGNAYGSYSRVRSLQDVLSFFPVREGQYSVLVTRTGEWFTPPNTAEAYVTHNNKYRKRPAKFALLDYSFLLELRLHLLS